MADGMAAGLVSFLVGGLVVSVIWIGMRELVTTSGNTMWPGYGEFLWYFVFIIIWVGDVTGILALARSGLRGGL